MSVLGSLVTTGARLMQLENPERVGVGVVLVGGVAAVVTLLVGSFITVSGTAQGILHTLAVLLPLVGGLLVVVTAGWGLKGRLNLGNRPDPLVEGDPPERGSIRSIRDVDAGEPIERVAIDRYRCQRDESAVDVRGRLFDGAARTLIARNGLGRAAARDAIRTGEWTDDRVAAAFLSRTVSLPLAERLRNAVDPGAAYTRRVRRTLSAIEAIGAETPAEEEPTVTGAGRDTDRPKAVDQEGAR